MPRYVIIGAGIAGTTAAEELRKIDAGAEIVLVGEEEHPLYSRVLLAPYVMGKVLREKCFLKKDSWYEEQRIEYVRGEYVGEINVKNKYVALLHAGREIPYDRLLITTGGEPIYLDHDMKGVSYLRTIDDADHLSGLIASACTSGNCQVVVDGGGFIACEYINVFRHFDFDVSCVHRGRSFWSRVLDVASGNLIRQKLESNGVKIFPNAKVEGIVGDDALKLIKTTSGDVSASVLGVGIGLERNLNWIRSAGVNVGCGVRVNEFLETNVEGVYSAGDVCEYRDAITGREILSSSWMGAIMQGRVAAKNMAGARELFRLVPSYSVSLLGMDIIFIGDIRRELADEIVSHGSEGSGYVAQLFLSRDKLVGATLVGGNKDRAEITRQIESQADFEKLS
jgi:NAD(P)H-nitrite reductase large subunit